MFHGHEPHGAGAWIFILSVHIGGIHGSLGLLCFMCFSLLTDNVEDSNENDFDV